MDTVRTSLPYAYDLIASLAAECRDDTAEFTDNQPPVREGTRPTPAPPRQRRDPGQP